MNYRLHVFALIFLSFSASAITAQVPSPTPVTPDQKAILAEANELSRNAVQLHRERKLDEALPLAKRAIELRRRILGDHDPLTAEAVSNLGTIYVAKQKFEEAEDEFKKALSMYESSGFTVPHMAYVLDTLALLRWRVRDFDKAESLAKRALTFKEQLHLPSSNLLESIDNLVKIYESAEKTRERNALVSRVVSMVEEKKIVLTDRQLFFRFRCLLLDGKQTADTVDLVKRIETILEWAPSVDSAQQPASGGVLNGRALVLPKPAYPAEARAVRAQGTVVVQVWIDECGKVVKAQAVSGASSLRPISEAAARKALFTPTLLLGSPTPVTGVIQYNFVAR